MPLSKLSTSFFRTTSKETRDVNVAIDQFNAGPTGINLDKIQAFINAPGRAHWTSQAGEIVRLELAINQARRALAGSGQVGSTGILGATAVVNLNPTTWIETLFDDAPSLDGVSFDGSGKEGAQGNTHKLLLPNGKKLFAKTDHGASKNNAETECEREYRVYERFYKTIVGHPEGHPNLVKVWGWADIKLGIQHEVGFIMDHIEGPDGRTMQRWLKEAWDLGIISSAEYWSSIQYIGRCHLDVIHHLQNAGWAHNDIKSENYVVDSITGEVIVIDLGGAGLLGHNWNAVTAEYLAPEMLIGDKPNRAAKGAVASDLFSLGATIVHATEAAHAFHPVARPNRGLASNVAPSRVVGSGVDGLAAGRYKNPFEYGVETDYTRQIKRLMNDNPLEREKALDEHSSNRFLNDSILNDQQTRDVLKGVASGSRKADWEDRWRRAGKIPPTFTAVDRTSLASTLKDKMRPYRPERGYGGIDLPPDMTKERARIEELDLNRKKREVEEIARLVNQANAFRIDTKHATQVMKELLKQIQRAELMIKAALNRPAVAAAPPRRR
ncbi:hypothetical protein M0D69_13475 [Caballeronia sp. SEWSISQ10-4 2]|uniref:protein kinase domain-containing protein n=1 Tax=Caballeronia sp. SEWSISQ10-4 2 TaxID=2937438 RepID=UPI00264B9825|nr:hypothetical protein [Caballeronia sp. SEWSISQ10-4 2]MDN7179007.1 hypothetical protein [Caballeronia sp. SEWSISQ10-4 2]